MQPTFPHIRFWGTRGSRPQADEQYSHFGKQTTCVEIELPQQILIFDAGTGFYDFSDNYMARPAEQQKPIAVFIGHMHFDHVIGAEQAAVMFNGTIKKTVFGHHLQWDASGQVAKTGDFTVDYQRLFSEPYSPDLAKKHVEIGKVTLHDLSDHIDQTMKLLDEYAVQFLPLRHGEGLALGVRLQHGDERYCILTDLSLHDYAASEQGRVANFCRNANLVIADGMYRREDFTKMPFLKSFGHSAAEDVIDVCAAADVQRLLISHHPMSSDSDLTAQESFLQGYAARHFPPISVTLARMGNYDIPPQLKQEPGLVLA